MVKLLKYQRVNPCKSYFPHIKSQASILSPSCFPRQDQPHRGAAQLPETPKKTRWVCTELPRLYGNIMQI